MPRRNRPPQTQRSEHWLRCAVNDCPELLNAAIEHELGWIPGGSTIQWLSPMRNDDYAEYFDQSFLDRLGITDLRVPLQEFWPPGGSRWDGLARTSDNKVLLVEAKAYIEESVDFGSKAADESLRKIRLALSSARTAFGASVGSSWETPFYQYANRLAHLHFLYGVNDVDAYLVFVYFADAPDVPQPQRTSVEQWRGAIRLTQRCLGLGSHAHKSRVGHVILPVPDLQCAMGRASTS